jgi:hypothetical protein
MKASENGKDDIDKSCEALEAREALEALEVI